MMLRRSLLLILALLVVVPAAAQERSRLHGALVPGSHAVGFRVLNLTDASRGRSFTVHLWYPAASASGARMTFRDATVAHVPADPPHLQATREEDTRRFFAQFGGIADTAWQELLATPMLARRDAAAGAGPFPLVIGTLRPLSTSVTNEYLASHGYVVAMTWGPAPPSHFEAGAGLDVAFRDMEFAIPELRKLPFVDGRRLAALGFSGAGFSQFLLAMRHPGVQAICDLESAIFDDGIVWSLQKGWGYDVGALRVPFLHTYSVPLSKRENRFADFEAMRYSTRFHYLVDAPGIHHWDFATEGMASSLFGVRGEQAPRLREVFEVTNRYVLAFFDAHVKEDASALAFLRRDPAANGAPAGLATIRELPGIRPAPTTAEFEALIASAGIARAMEAFEAARQRDGSAPLFLQGTLNGVAYRLLRERKRVQDAIVVFRRILELYPASGNAHDSLAEALETAGDHAGAVEISKKGLAVIEKENMPENRKQQITAGMLARLKRLSR